MHVSNRALSVTIRRALSLRPRRNISLGRRSAGDTRIAIGAAPDARRISSETSDPTLPRKEPTGRNGRSSADMIHRR